MLTEIKKIPDQDKSDIRNLDTRMEAEYHMDRIGFTRIGDGKRGTAFHKPGTNFVIKVFENTDLPYIRWVDWCMHHQNNSFLPRFKGKVMRLSEKLSAIRIELLKPSRITWQDSINLKTYLYHYDLQEWMEDIRVWWTSKNHADYVPSAKDITDWREMCRYLFENKYYVDVHPGNLMKRLSDDHLVFVDPMGYFE